VADYQTDERRGFIEPNTVTVNRGANLAWVGYNSTNHNSFDVSVDTLGSRETTSGGGDFLPIGGDGVVRGQLVWTSSADLDLHRRSRELFNVGQSFKTEVWVLWVLEPEHRIVAGFINAITVEGLVVLIKN
jgi:hypothetical protein